MFKIDIKTTGFDVSKLEREIKANAFAEIKRDISRKVTGIRCPTHGRSPSVRFTETRNGITAHIEGCCDDIVKKAEAAISR